MKAIFTLRYAGWFGQQATVYPEGHHFDIDNRMAIAKLGKLIQLNANMLAQMAAVDKATNQNNVQKWLYEKIEMLATMPQTRQQRPN